MALELERMCCPLCNFSSLLHTCMALRVAPTETMYECSVCSFSSRGARASLELITRTPASASAFLVEATLASSSGLHASSITDVWHELAKEGA